MSGEQFKDLIGRRILSGTGQRFCDLTEYRILEVSESLNYVKVELVGVKPMNTKWFDCSRVPVIEVLPVSFTDRLIIDGKLSLDKSIDSMFGLASSKSDDDIPY